jgi:hypothetical protein
MNNNTAPEQRPDKNGKVVTRHVKTGEATKAPIVVPAPNMSLPVQSDLSKALFSDVAGTDFSGMDENEVAEAVTAVTNSISKDNLWDSYSVLTKGMETTDHPEAMGEAIGANKTAAKLRDTWLDMHGANIADRGAYIGIDGQGGYEDYKTAHGGFSAVYEARLPESSHSGPIPRSSLSEGDLNVEVYTPGAISPERAPAEAPIPVDDAYGDALIASGTSTDFGSMDENQVRAAVTAVTNRISKDTLWSALDVLTKVAEDTKGTGVVNDALAQNKGAVKLRDTWLSMHGANLADRHIYSKVEGENGYKRYYDAFLKLSDAASFEDK